MEDKQLFVSVITGHYIDLRDQSYINKEGRQMNFIDITYSNEEVKAA